MSRLLALVLLLLLAAPGAATAQTAPPPVAGMSEEELTSFRAHLQTYWLLPDEAAGVVVTVGFALTPEGKVEDGEVRLLSHSGAPEAAVEAAFQAARRAVLRALAQGYPLPPERYADWRVVELTFDPGTGVGI